MFHLATGGQYLSWSNTNQARVSIDDNRNTDRDKEAAQLQVSGSILLWLGTLIATAVVWAPNDSNVATRVKLLGIPLPFAAFGVSLLWAFDTTAGTSKPFDGATVTIVLFVYAILGAVGQERQALCSGALVLLGSNGWFLFQRLFEAQSDGDGHAGVEAGFVLCWLSCIFMAAVLLYDSETHNKSGRIETDRKGNSIEDFDHCLASLGVNQQLNFVAESSEGDLRMMHTKISFGVIYLGTWTFSFVGLDDRARTAVLRATPQSPRPLKQVLGDLTTLARFSLCQWQVSQTSNEIRGVLEFEPSTSTSL